MGLLSILKKVKRKEKEVRLLILGLDNAGKTTVVKKFMGKPTDTISPTLGFEITTLEVRGFTLNIWDVGGQSTIRAYWRNYFEQTDGLVWVIDSGDRARMHASFQELQTLLMQERLAGASLLVLANKQDLANAMRPDEIAQSLALAEACKNRHWRIQGCSAVTGAGLEDGVQWVVDDIASRIFMLD